MKALVLSVLLMLPVFGTLAQDGMKIGVGFGPALTFARSETNDVLTAENSGLGSRLSLTGKYGFSENYGIQTGVALTTQAFGNKDNSSGKTRISTIELPFGLALRTNELNNNSLFVSGFVGPTIDINIASRLTQGGEQINNNDQVRPFGISMRFGLGAEKELDFGTVYVGLSYVRGLTNVAKDQPGVITRVHYLALEGIFFF